MPDTPVGLTKDAGWQIGVSRTLPVTTEEAFAVVLSPEGLAVWRGDGVDCASTPTGCSAEEREELRAHWKAVVQRLEPLFVG